jgi:uncharacterized cofD-like protein
MPKVTKKPNIVVMGGGTGTSVVLEGLKKYPVNLSAIITTADDGSSSGKLREEFNMIPPGDIRQCLVALAAKDFSYLNERFQTGSLAGHTLGNLLITLFWEKHKNFQEAIDELLAVTGAEGSLIPMTLEPTVLVAKLKNGKLLKGERNITPSKEIRDNLKRLYLEPKYVKANPRAVSAIKKADMIIVGPGNLFSSIIPNFLILQIRDAFTSARAKKIYVANLFTQPGHTDGFTLTDFVEKLSGYIGRDVFSYVIYNNKHVPKSIVASYKNPIVESQILGKKDFADKRYIARAIAKVSPRVISADPIAKMRNPFLHDTNKLAKAIMELCV